MQYKNCDVSLGPIQDLQPKGLPRPPTLQKNGSAPAPGSPYKRRATDRRYDPELRITILLLACSAALYVVLAKVLL